MTDGWNFFDEPVKTNLRAYDNIWKIATGQGDDYATGCLLDYPLFQKLLQDDINSLSKEQDPKVTQQINFTGNLKREGNTTFFIIEESKKKQF